MRVRVGGSGFRVQGSGFRVLGSGFRVGERRHLVDSVDAEERSDEDMQNAELAATLLVYGLRCLVT